MPQPGLWPWTNAFVWYTVLHLKLFLSPFLIWQYYEHTEFYHRLPHTCIRILSWLSNSPYKWLWPHWIDRLLNYKGSGNVIKSKAFSWTKFGRESLAKQSRRGRPVQRTLFHQYFCYVEILLWQQEPEITLYLSRQSMLAQWTIIWGASAGFPILKFPSFSCLHTWCKNGSDPLLCINSFVCFFFFKQI